MALFSEVYPNRHISKFLNREALGDSALYLILLAKDGVGLGAGVGLPREAPQSALEAIRDTIIIWAEDRPNALDESDLCTR